jgi:glutamate-1-semialdehyde 2,1-aminomutase
MNGVLAQADVAWAVYGTYSGFHVFTNPHGREVTPVTFDPLQVAHDELRNNDPAVVNALRLAMAVHGVDLNGWPGGLVSAVHDDADVERTAQAFRHSIALLRQSGLLP